jgi:UDP-N-acetylmuramoyl-tripeptide--D-alanyl-D-alanine ligase
MPARILAVTGSVGKTTTKGMIASILEACAPTITAERSFNNEIGVPLTLLRLGRGDRFCVLEFAMRGPGEIRALAEIARPEVGVITNIGLAHVGRLGSVEAIAEAKAELLPLLPRTGVAVLNRRDVFFEKLAGRTPARVLSFGQHPEADVRAEGVELRGLEGCAFALHVPGQTARMELSVPGEHCVPNALAAAAATYALGVDIARIAEGLSRYAGESLRGLVKQAQGGYTVIADCYNASPASVQAALQLLSQVTGRRLLVFGDMAELGEAGPEAHRAVGEQTAAAGVTDLVTIGDLAPVTGQTAAERGVTWTHAPSAAEAVAFLRPRLRPGDVVLVKGSRAMRLEDVVEGLLSDA